MKQRRKTGWRVLTLLRRRGVALPGIEGVREAHYFHAGTWFHSPETFPCIYLDDNGYVIFTSEDEFCRSRGLSLGVNLNVPHGISSLPGYRELDPRPALL